MDIVYPLASKTGDPTDELRYSLRSLQNIPHDRVWVLTNNLPQWIANVEWLEVGDPSNTRYKNTTRKLKVAAEYSDISDNFMWWNDDFYALKPTGIPVWHKGELPTIKAPADSGWLYVKRLTRELLERRGYTTLDYEMHLPFIFNKQKVRETVFEGVCHPRSVYGNQWQVGGEKAADVKIRGLDKPLPSGPWASSYNGSWKGLVGQQIRELFNKPCEYEEAA